MCVYRDIVLYSVISKEISPSSCDRVNIGLAAVSLFFGTDNIENFVGGIGFTIDGLINGNRATTLCRKRRHRHGAQQGNSQQSRHEFFERLFHRL